MAKQKANHHPCWVKEGIHEILRESFREDVCASLSTDEHEGGRHFCLLHSPSGEKDVSQFEDLVSERILRQQSLFQAVVFPSTFTLNRPNLDKPLNLTHATFKSGFNIYKGVVPYLLLDDAVFHGKFELYKVKLGHTLKANRARFIEDVEFLGCHININAFEEACFEKQVAFDLAVEFHEDANFLWARFAGGTIFRDTTFHKAAFFVESQFPSDEPIVFERARFRGRAEFDNAFFNGYCKFASIDKI